MEIKDKEKIKQDLLKYENEKKKRRLAALGTLTGIGTAGIGAYKRNTPATLLGATLTGASAYLGGKASRERNYALSRIKKHYDLRDRKFVDLGAVLPTADKMTKTAIAGGLAELATALPALVRENWMPMSEFVTHHVAPIAGMGAGAATALRAAIPSAIDLAATPYLAKKVMQRGFDYAKVFAKHKVGKPLSAEETKMLGTAIKRKAGLAAAEASKTPVIGPLRRYFTGFLSGPAGTGSKMGDVAGEVLKQVGEVSPRYQELGLNAINDSGARSILADTMKTDINKIQSGLDMAKNTKLYKFLTNVSGKNTPSAKKFISEIVERPERINELISSYKDKETAATNAINMLKKTETGKFIQALGSHSKHDLSTNAGFFFNTPKALEVEAIKFSLKEQQVLEALKKLKNTRLGGLAQSLAKKKGGSIQNTLVEGWKNPAKLMATAEKIQDIENRVVETLATTGATLAGAGGFYALGKAKPLKHPLAKDEVPKQIAKSQVQQLS